MVNTRMIVSGGFAWIFFVLPPLALHAYDPCEELRSTGIYGTSGRGTDKGRDRTGTRCTSTHRRNLRGHGFRVF
mgnify:CR=1 FL=1